MYSKIEGWIKVLNDEAYDFGAATTEKSYLRALDKIAEIGEPYDAQYIVNHIFSNNKLVAQKAASSIRKLLVKPQVKKIWLNLHKSFSYPYYKPGSWLDKDFFKQFEFFLPEEAAHLYGIISFNSNGYLREKALDYLNKIMIPESLPYILLRLNDWVPQVQIKAEKILENILPKISINDLLKCYNLIEWLEVKKRTNLKHIQDKIFTHIFVSGQKELLFKTIKNFPFKERLFLWKILAKEIDDDFIDKILSDPAPEIRQWAVVHLPQIKLERTRLDSIIKDKAIRVRYTLLKVIPQNEINYKTYFAESIFDDSKLIRELARFVMRSYGDGNFVDKYYKKISKSNGKTLPGVLAGLTEVCDKKDVPFIKKFVNSKNAKIRASVLLALKRLEVDDVDDLYINALQDISSVVRKSAASILQIGYSHLRPKLEKLLEVDNVKIKILGLSILTNYGVLDSLRDILFLLKNSSDELQEVVWNYLYSWHKKNAVKLGSVFYSNMFSTRILFNFTDNKYQQNIYQQILELIKEIKKSEIETPNYVLEVWNNICYIMKAKNF